MSGNKIQAENYFLKKILFGFLRIKRTLFPDYHFASIPWVGVFFKFLISMLKSNFVSNVQGHQMYLDEKDTHDISLNRIYELCETSYFQNEVKKGSVVLDIGANIGYYTLLFAKQVGFEGHVFAFEPEPQNFSLLSKNVQINHYTNVTLVNKCVSSITGTLKLFLSEDNKGDHRIYNSHDGRKYIEVDSIRLDDYFKNFNQEINLIKMDIQGAEYFAVEGMAALLSKNPNLILVTEFEPSGLLRAGIQPQIYLELLSDFGFTLYQINESKRRIENTNIQQLLKMCTSNDGMLTNLICSKNDNSSRKLK